MLAPLLLVAVTGIIAVNVPEVAQRDKQFSLDRLEIQRGGVVRFPNYDPFFHNIYSLSPAKIFDLGSFPKGESREVKFDTPGVVEVRCAIHPGMKMTIVVK